MKSQTAPSGWPALQQGCVMGVRIHASAHDARASHSMLSPPCLHSSHQPPWTAKGGQGREGKGKLGVRWRVRAWSRGCARICKHMQESGNAPNLHLWLSVHAPFPSPFPKKASVQTMCLGR